MAMPIDSDTCTACGDCLPLCPTQSISAGKVFYKIDAATCAECDGHADAPMCGEVCPSGSISPIWPFRPSSQGESSMSAIPAAASIRVAFAANASDLLDGYFGSCARFLIYEVGPRVNRLLEVRDTEAADAAEDRNAARAALIGDCQILYVQSIGGPAAAKVVRAGVHPLNRPAGGAVAGLLAELQARLEQPPLWLARAMGGGERVRLRCHIRRASDSAGAAVAKAVRCRIRWVHALPSKVTS